MHTPKGSHQTRVRPALSKTRNQSSPSPATFPAFAFKHDSELGNAPAHKLFERVTIESKLNSNGAESASDDYKPARSFDDYEMKVDDKDLPDGISIEYPF